VIDVFDVGQLPESGIYLVMQLLEGDALADLLRSREPVAPASVASVLAQALAGLEAAHAAGVVHRDVKPANVLIDPGPEVFLGDFGLARDNEGSQLTLPGQVLGTIDYMAPELLDGERVGPATDIYGLACLAVETLTGTVPYVRETDAAIMYAHIVDPPPSVSERRPELPRALDAVLAAGMAKAPEERPASAGALVIDVLGALGRPAPACLAEAA
jgi:serine/threonine-protein kinase